MLGIFIPAEGVIGAVIEKTGGSVKQCRGAEILGARSLEPGATWGSLGMPEARANGSRA